MEDNIKLNIRPKASIYAYFTNLSYQEEFALAEFVDNSTSSYFYNKDILNKSANCDKVNIFINYDNVSDTIEIIDDAYGMELEDFQRAILLDSRPNDNTFRNEYGMGLKTAATWFGRRWEVESSQYGSNNKYSAYIDIDEIIDNNIEEIDIKQSTEDEEKHYTIIRISKLNKPLNTRTIENRIKEVLSSVYRRDIQTGEIQIYFNGKMITYKQYSILTDFRGQDWHRDISFSFEYAGEVYETTGFVDIRWPGSFKDTGFALFRRNRVVVDKYAPKEIFGQKQSPTSLKLRGELNMDSFPISQAKNQLAWTTDLEQEFIKQLKITIADYLVVAKMMGHEIETEKNLKEFEKEQPKPNREQDNKNKINIITSKDNNTPDTSFSSRSKNSDLQEVINKEICYLKYNGDVYTFNWEYKNNAPIYTYKKEEKIIDVNFANDFIKNLNKRSDSEISVSMIILAYIIAIERTSSWVNDKNQIIYSIVLNQINGILSEIEVVE